MKQLSALFATALLAALPALAQDQPKADPAQPQAQPAPVHGGQAQQPAALQDRARYIIGANLGQSRKSQEVPGAVDLIIQSLRDGLGGANALLPPEEIHATMQGFQQQLMAQPQPRPAAAA